MCVCDLAGLDELCPEEFVAHASTVNCLKIGRKSSRVLVTGGEDHKVNLWAIGKPNAILVRSPLLFSGQGFYVIHCSYALFSLCPFTFS